MAEFVLTAMFLLIILGRPTERPGRLRSDCDRAWADADPLGRHPGHELSVNPARTTGPALFAGGWALAQLWLFWVAPIAGGAVGGILYRWLSEEPGALVTGTETEPQFWTGTGAEPI